MDGRDDHALGDRPLCWGRTLNAMSCARFFYARRALRQDIQIADSKSFATALSEIAAERLGGAQVGAQLTEVGVTNAQPRPVSLAQPVRTTRITKSSRRSTTFRQSAWWL